jgi:hypothetical protein
MIPYFHYHPERQKRSYRKRYFFGASIALLFLGSTYYLFPISFFDKQQTVATVQSGDTSVQDSATLSDWVSNDPSFDTSTDISDENAEDEEFPVLSPPPAPSMDLMKKRGCVADGFLSGYGDDINSSIAMINRSQCYYLHRALETWLKPPDFKLARKIKAKVTKPNTVYGMFIAEAIDTKEEYWYPQENRYFNFSEMCRPGSKNAWGEHTCKPTLASEEYRKYVEYITEQAMNMGVQSFMFGQVFYQDATDIDDSFMLEVMGEMHSHADFIGLKIFIGAQTNDIDNEQYLRLFDYIEGGIGLAADGSVEDGPCFSRWWKQEGDWCWALLWNSRFADKANNVFLHLDWSGTLGDDMDTFTKMDKDMRTVTLKNLHSRFTSQGFGFLMPMLATLHKDDIGCRGPKKRFYSASRKYTCQDEDAINAILSGG